MLWPISAVDNWAYTRLLQLFYIKLYIYICAKETCSAEPQ